MSRSHTQHLTDAEFADLLAGEQPGETQHRHLSSCAHCRAELEAVQLSLGAFSATTARWAERAASTRVPAPSRWRLGLSGWPTLLTGATLTALAGVLLFHLGPVPRAGAAAPAPQPLAAEASLPNKTEIANDNRLMLSIDEELSSRRRSGAFAAELSESEGTSSAQPAATVVD